MPRPYAGYAIMRLAMANGNDKDLRHNFIVNVLDGGFFGLGIGFASFVTIIPLFVSQMTDSAILIGLIPAIHAMGWQLPQLLTVDHVTRLSRYKPTVVLMTLQERLPYLGLAAVAWFLPMLHLQAALVITFLLLIWQGLGGGFTATAWQAMIGKIIPGRRVGIFFGVQSAAANLFASGSAIAAGIFLQRFETPVNFALCFLMTSIAMAVSWFFLASTREETTAPSPTASDARPFWDRMGTILKRDANFRWFLAARMLSQIGVMAFGFYTVYAVRHHGMDGWTAGLMTATLTATQIVANPLMGWIGDHWGHRAAMALGALAAAGSALLAWLAPGIAWFYPAFVLAGIANVAAWTIAIAMTLEFSTGADRPAYIGLANTLIAPSTILAPLFGGWLADTAGYHAMFLLSVIGGLATALVFHAMLGDPRQGHNASPATTEIE
ncbi:MAG: MFS transporter [Chloroflexota bacterium]|nr:MFS transporter [Chloroflexota bacterium]